jgi:hypothetical protein
VGREFNGKKGVDPMRHEESLRKIFGDVPMGGAGKDDRQAVLLMSFSPG